jgi:hypothetical protein
MNLADAVPPGLWRGDRLVRGGGRRRRVPVAGASAAQAVTDSFRVVFEANSDVLALTQLDGATSVTTLGMERGTSPAIAALPGGGWVAAFQAVQSSSTFANMWRVAAALENPDIIAIDQSGSQAATAVTSGQIEAVVKSFDGGTAVLLANLGTSTSTGTFALSQLGISASEAVGYNVWRNETTTFSGISVTLPEGQTETPVVNPVS